MANKKLARRRSSNASPGRGVQPRFGGVFSPGLWVLSGSPECDLTLFICDPSSATQLKINPQLEPHLLPELRGLTSSTLFAATQHVTLKAFAESILGHVAKFVRIPGLAQIEISSKVFTHKVELSRPGKESSELVQCCVHVRATPKGYKGVGSIKQHKNKGYLDLCVGKIGKAAHWVALHRLMCWFRHGMPPQAEEAEQAFLTPEQLDAKEERGKQRSELMKSRALEQQQQQQQQQQQHHVNQPAGSPPFTPATPQQQQQPGAPQTPAPAKPPSPWKDRANIACHNKACQHRTGRGCCCPFHLEWGTTAINTAQGVKLAKRARGKEQSHVLSRRAMHRAFVKAEKAGEEELQAPAKGSKRRTDDGASTSAQQEQR